MNLENCMELYKSLSRLKDFEHDVQSLAREVMRNNYVCEELDSDSGHPMSFLDMFHEIAGLDPLESIVDMTELRKDLEYHVSMLHVVKSIKELHDRSWAILSQKNLQNDHHAELTVDALQTREALQTRQMLLKTYLSQLMEEEECHHATLSEPKKKAYAVIREAGKKREALLADEVIRVLKCATKGMLSDADEGFESTWEEICARVHEARRDHEEEIWDSYEDIVTEQIDSELELLDETETRLLCITEVPDCDCTDLAHTHVEWEIMKLIRAKAEA